MVPGQKHLDMFSPSSFEFDNEDPKSPLKNEYIRVLKLSSEYLGLNALRRF